MGDGMARGAADKAREASDAPAVDADQQALDERIDDIIAMHDGNWRAALETLLIVADARADTISFGYVRGRAPGMGLLGPWD